MDRSQLNYRLAGIGFLLIAKGGRQLRTIDGAMAHVPFPYDPHFFEYLRPDQAPRFLGCLTNPDQLELRDMELDSLSAIQDRVHADKVHAMRGSAGKPPIVVRTNGRDYIADGHHRAAAAYLDGADRMPMRFKDLSPYTLAVKARPASDAFLRSPRVGDRVSVELDVGSATNAPWTSQIVEVISANTDRMRVRVAYDEGSTVYSFEAADCENMTTQRRMGAYAHWYFRKSRR